MITVPDERLNKLVELVQPQNVVPAVVEIVDIAGLVKGASKGEGLGNKFLANTCQYPRDGCDYPCIALFR